MSFISRKLSFFILVVFFIGAVPLHIPFINFSGKSTLACSLSRELHSKGKLSYVLDGDNLRHGLNKGLGFSAEDRTENIRRVGESDFIS